VAAPGPEEPLLHVLQREGALEPGMERAGQEEEVRPAVAQRRRADGEAVVFPHVVGDRRVVARHVPLEPAREARRVAVVRIARSESVHAGGKIREPWRAGTIERYD